MVDSVPVAPWRYRLRLTKSHVSFVMQELGRSFLSRCAFYWHGGTLSGLCSSSVPFRSSFCRMSREVDRQDRGCGKWSDRSCSDMGSASRQQHRRFHFEHGHHRRNSQSGAEGAILSTSFQVAAFDGGARAVHRWSRSRGRDFPWSMSPTHRPSRSLHLRTVSTPPPSEHSSEVRWLRALTQDEDIQDRSDQTEVQWQQKAYFNRAIPVHVSEWSMLWNSRSGAQDH